MHVDNWGGSREGAGRKRRNKYGKFSVTVDQKLLDRLDRYCRKRERTRSDVVEEILTDALKRK